MTDLRKHPVLLQPGCESTWPFSSGSTRYDVTLTAREGEVLLESGPVRTRVRLERVPMRFGGHRTWFLCPACGQRRGMMFLGSNAWACRCCLRLKYPSSREDRHGRLGRKMQKRMRRLGSGWTNDLRSLDKPRWMRWRTYWKLREELAHLDHDRALELLGSIGARYGSLEALMARSRLTQGG